MMFEHKPRLRVTIEHRPAGYQGIDDETPIRRADIGALFRLAGIAAAGLFLCGMLSSGVLFMLRGGGSDPDAAALVLSGTSPIVSTWQSDITLSPEAIQSDTPIPTSTPTLTNTDTPIPTLTALPTTTPTPTIDVTQIYLDVYGPLANATYEKLISTAVESTLFARVTDAPYSIQRTQTANDIRGMTQTIP